MATLRALHYYLHPDLTNIVLDYLTHDWQPAMNKVIANIRDPAGESIYTYDERFTTQFTCPRSENI